MAKKTTTKKAPAVKKQATTTRKSVPKKRTAKKSSTRSKSSLVSQIGLQREESDFMTFQITRQTVYWLVLGFVVIMFTVWLMKLQGDIQALYDQIDANTAAMSEIK